MISSNQFSWLLLADWLKAAAKTNLATAGFGI